MLAFATFATKLTGNVFLTPFVLRAFHSVILCFLHLSQNQAKLFIEQKKIPFPVENHNTNEELGKLAFCF